MLQQKIQRLKIFQDKTSRTTQNFTENSEEQNEIKYSLKTDHHRCPLLDPSPNGSRYYKLYCFKIDNLSMKQTYLQVIKQVIYII